MNIGDNIKRIRVARNLSQKEVITIARLTLTIKPLWKKYL